MQQPPKISYRSYLDLSAISHSFLKEHGREDDVPVDVEALLEFDLDVSIIPTPGFQQAHEVEASLSRDMKSIYIDEYVYRSRENRYQFSLAHELGHIVLHHELFEKSEIDDIEDWKSTYNGIDSDSYASMEKQAYDFAGLFLVPAFHLWPRFSRLFADNETQFEKAAAGGVSRDRALEYFKATASFRLAPVFKVSTEVIDRRIDKDGLMSLFHQ